MKKLLSAGADVNEKELGHVLVGALVNTTAQYKRDFKMARMEYIPENHSHVTCVNLLIEAGADVNAKVGNGVTALINAARSNRSECVDLLIQAGMVQNALTCHLEHSETMDGDMSRLLLAAGEILDNDDDLEEIMQGILQLTDVKMQLKHICREAIRKHLLELDPHQHLFGKIPLLGLPEIIKEYLLYNETLEENESEQ